MNPETISLNRLFGAFSLIFFFAISWHINKLLNKNLKISVLTSSLISKSYDSRLKKLIDLNIFKLNSSQIKKELNLQHYPIDSIEKRSKSNCNNILKIKFEAPKYKLFLSNSSRASLENIQSLAKNKQDNYYKILISSGELINKDFYSQEAQENLPIIYTKEENINPQEAVLILNFLKNISPDILENYYISWHDKTNITFCDKQDSFFYLKAENLSLLDNNLLNKVNKIKEKLKREHNTKRKNNIWCADLRFRDKIVLSFKGEGEHEGKKFIR